MRAEAVGQALQCHVCRKGRAVLKDQEVWNLDGIMYRLAECQFCGSAFTTPLPTNKVLKELYARGFDFRWYRDHLWAKKKDASIRYNEYKPLLGASVLDFGGGFGYFSSVCRSRGHPSVTYDPYAPSAGTVAGSKFDTVVALHVLEHGNDIDSLILQMRAFLKPAGTLILAVPNYKGAGYRRRGMRWVWAQPPLVHIHHFTAEGLTALLSRRGFGELNVSYHERWDANLYCDCDEANDFEKWDGMWGRKPYNGYKVYRRLIAIYNSARRFRGLMRAVRLIHLSDESLSELQITAKLKA
jgi:SAM-dependent methyltransferase